MLSITALHLCLVVYWLMSANPALSPRSATAEAAERGGGRPRIGTNTRIAPHAHSRIRGEDSWRRFVDGLHPRRDAAEVLSGAVTVHE